MQASYVIYNSVSLTPVPTTEHTMPLFAAHLALQGITHSTIKAYFSSIGNLHLSCSQHNAYHHALTPRLEQIFRGIKREQASRYPQPVCLPITVEILHKMHSILSKPPIEYQDIMLWAACCTAFFGFLRVGEITVPSKITYDHSVHLSLQDVALDSRTSPSIVWLTIKQSKTVPFRKGVKLCLGITDSVVCPVKLAIRGGVPSSLFLSEGEGPLTRAQFKTLVSATLRKA